MDENAITIIPAFADGAGGGTGYTRILAGFPLIAWSVAAAALGPAPRRILVMTNDSQTAEAAKAYGAAVWSSEEAHPVLATELFRLVERMEAEGRTIPSYGVLLSPECPHRDPQQLTAAMETFAAHPQATSLLAVHRAPASARRFRMAGDSVFLREAEPASGEQEERYESNGYIDIVRLSGLRRSGDLYGDHPLPFVTASQDTGGEEPSFRRIHTELSRGDSPLIPYLQGRKDTLHTARHEPFSLLSSRCPELAHLQTALIRVRSMLVDAVQGGGKILVAGNGGSCADALHFSGELLKSFVRERPVDGETRRVLGRHAFGDMLADSLEMGIPVVVLGQNAALASAYLNDRHEFRAYLAQECLALAQPGDVLVGFSTSGNAENLLWAMAVAEARGARTVAFTGKTGGKMGMNADIELRSPETDTARVQEHHLAMYHALCVAIEAEIFPDSPLRG